MRMLTGFLPLSGGKIEIGGHDIETAPIAAKALFGYLPENAPAYNDMTVEDFLAFCAAIRGFSGDEKKNAVEKAIETCHLQKVRRQSIDTLSKGYFHRCCFAQAILHDPPVLVLDEPTDGLDPNQKHEKRMLIRDLGKARPSRFTHISRSRASAARHLIIDRETRLYGSPANSRPVPTTLAPAGPHSFYADIVAPSPHRRRRAVSKSAKTPGRHGAGRAKTTPSPGAAIQSRLDGKHWQFDELHTTGGWTTSSHHHQP